MIRITRIKNIDKKMIDAQLKREEASFEVVDQTVKEIIENVKQKGDDALIHYTEQFDGVHLQSLKVTEQEVREALTKIDARFLEILKQAKDNIREFHQHQFEKSWFINKDNGIILGQKVTPLERVGVYVPGGKAAYPSTVLMDVIPAVIAGVNEIVMVSPPNKEGKVNPAVLAAASVAGVTEIYKVSGAQSIAALSFGTESIRPVDKIVGPGNIYVARAKKYVFGKVDIDMIAGPSEICIIADGKQNPTFIAADLLSQAEHDEMAASVLVTESEQLAQDVQREVEKQLGSLDRNEIAKQSIKTFGNIFVVDTIDEAFTVANEIAPEHLELLLDHPLDYLPKVVNAGAIFLGAYSPEPLGDYFAGPNHTLPTSGTAKFSSPLGTYDFLKRSSVIYYRKNNLADVKDQIIQFANEEGLTAHANSIRIRFDK
ncbi:histidinol dehydrogenase [Bacillus andreraoultii]|uniref:histidinol dehydrogenase n=1 Tax=Bacillus andreraoultii TaxID=1499685 RepID=UPI00053B3716|nr:histidinol dehydrogenase [Bacillus andreraoultii]